MNHIKTNHVHSFNAYSFYSLSMNVASYKAQASNSFLVCKNQMKNNFYIIVLIENESSKLHLKKH